ncbi:MAG: hypothetical protein COV74_00330 [Candidatus Omnitrophica bacterium CG11_big_fil_rev_8_21_14_0_20_45_26]|uniref:HEAT repeat domain-containing protein n=1 Tax=Candidatus Abzuiibacterium crystallinum TaxID=1974748 RepID=A0A2H0LSZ2_9BACT|nr:MAG: hypothetical protein COV74_00330 [Candidatus Omnitrophica bacterium CG11_big_fil_rev_8_21_14_0_20_45_26]PIW64615.1 MAG: hypothetical protein COW12_05450 [Candidatus Omnitrophica bacterium CG12_big_fil_rev_8_21_14_0_65_45_16]
MRKNISVWLSIILLICSKNAWALYGQPTTLRVIDWAGGIALILLAIYIFLNVRFKSKIGFRISLVLVVINVSGWFALEGYQFYISRMAEGFAGINRLSIADSAQSVLEQRLMPLSLLAICFLSKRVKLTMASLFLILITFCVIELGLNYMEINTYLSGVEQADYQDFEHGTDIRNYLSASGLDTLRLYPRTRTKKVLLAMLRSDSWIDRHNAAVALQYLRDRTVTPHLVECFQRQDQSDTADQARLACAETLQVLISGEDNLFAYERIQTEYKVNPEGLFKRLTEQAKQSR